MKNSVLVVDDNNTIRTLARGVLEEAGYDVVEAQNGAQGLERAKGASFVLVLADINMPVMGGLDMIRQIRALPAHAKTPILILSTENTMEIMKEGKEAGANGWMVKPFDRAKLLGVIGKLAARSAA